MNSYPCPPFDFPACPNTLEALQKAMDGEAGAIQYYGCLMELAPDRFQRDIIAHIRADEERHFNNFQSAYRALTGTPYNPPCSDMEMPKNYTEGLMKSFEDEQEAYEFYKVNFLCQSDNTVKCSFLDALMDEAEHGRWFNNFLIRGLMENHHHHH